MPDYIGLYYPNIAFPNIAFPNDAWVKLAALYWDKLGRVVPPDYIHDDSDVVHQLQEESGFIEDFTPSRSDILTLGVLFDDLLVYYGHQLVENYSVLSRDSDLAYIYFGHKITHSLSHRLLDLGLAVRKGGSISVDDLEQLWMHPKLVFIYMEALAARMALARNLQTITDNVRDHVSMPTNCATRYNKATIQNSVLATPPRLGVVSEKKSLS